jgi:Flp pilus assembly protein TadD
MLGRHERAIQDYDEAIRINPENANAYYGRGLAYGELGKSVESERDIQKAKFLGYDGL